MTDVYAATDWSRYDVPAIAAMLPADDYVDSWDQVKAWRTASETISDHQKELTKASAQLSEAWPPEHSLAAATYLDYVQGTSDSMTATADAAAANATALANVLNALTEAQTKIHQLHQRWQFQVSYGAGNRASGVQSPDTSSTQWKVALNDQAHKVMTETDQVVLENSRRMIVPVDAQRSGNESFRTVPIPTDELAKTSSLGLVSGTLHKMLPSRLPTSGGQTSTALRGSMPARMSDRPSAESALGPASAVALPVAGGLTGVIGAVAGSTISALRNRAESMPTTAVKEEHAGFITRSTVGQSSESTGDGSRQPNAGPTPGQSGGTATGEAHQATSADAAATPEPGELVSPGISTVPRSTGTNSAQRRRRGKAFSMPDSQANVPGLLVPREEKPIIHDPGPGVIGANR
jgi:hypothetical protein